MSDRFDGILVPSVSPAIIEAFQSYRPGVPLRMSQLEGRLTGICRYKSGYFQSDYQQLASRMSKIAGVAVILYFCDDSGIRCQILERTRGLREIGPTYDTGEDAGVMCELLNATFDDIETLLRYGGEPLSVNIPSVADAIRRIQSDQYEVGRSSVGPRLIKQAETVDRLLANGNASSKSLLTQLLEQLDLTVTRPSRDFAREIVQAWLEAMDNS